MNKDKLLDLVELNAASMSFSYPCREVIVRVKWLEDGDEFVGDIGVDAFGLIAKEDMTWIKAHINAATSVTIIAKSTNRSLYLDAVVTVPTLF